MKKMTLLLALFFVMTAAGAGKPYGCYKELRWGMNPDEAIKTLAATGIEPRKFEKDDILILTFPSFVPAGKEKLELSLSFKSIKLYRVDINFPFDDTLNQLCQTGAMKRISAYKLFREALLGKYGKPLKDVNENRSRSIQMEEAICQKAGMMEAEWETGESKIMLYAELQNLSPSQLGGRSFFMPLLYYIDKTQLPKEKADL